MVSSFLRGVFSVLGSKLGTMLIGVVTTPILVRLLGSTQYGEYAAILSIYGILIVFSESGIFDGTRKFLAEQREIEDWENYVFGFYFRWSIIISTVVSVVLVTVAITGYGQAVFPENHTIYFLLIALLLFSKQLSTMLRGTLMGLRKEHYSESLQVFSQFIFAITAIILVYYGFGVVGAVAGNILGVVVISVLSIWVVRSHLDLSKIFTRIPQLISARTLMFFNLKSAVLALLTVSLYHFDMLLIQTLVGSTETGYYKAALNLAQFLWLVPTAVQFILVQSISEQWSNGNQNQVTVTAAAATRYTLVFSILVVVGLAVLADVFVPAYYGTEFMPAIEPLLLLLPGVLGFAVARPIFAIGQGIGSLNKLVFATGAASAVNLILNVLLIPRYGMYGAAVSTSIGYGSMALFHTLAALRIGYNPVADLRTARIGIAGAILCVSLVLLKMLVSSDLLSLLILPPTGAIIYALAAIAIGAVTPSELLRLLDESPVESSRIEKLLKHLTRIRGLH